MKDHYDFSDLIAFAMMILALLSFVFTNVKENSNATPKL